MRQSTRLSHSAFRCGLRSLLGSLQFPGQGQQEGRAAVCGRSSVRYNPRARERAASQLRFAVAPRFATMNSPTSALRKSLRFAVAPRFATISFIAANQISRLRFAVAPRFATILKFRDRHPPGLRFAVAPRFATICHAGERRKIALRFAVAPRFATMTMRSGRKICCCGLRSLLGSLQ